MPQPSYNPWATPLFPNTGSAFGVGSPAEAAERQPTFVDSLLSHIAGALGRGFMAPGQALQSTTPITSDQMIAPAQDMLTLAQTAGMPRAAAGNAAGELGMAGGGIKAYHGSPHDFDRFDLSKIGTGEGAQAYGHGLYFAENEGVARSYRDALKWKGTDWDNPEFVGSYWLNHFGGDRQKTTAYLENALRQNSQMKSFNGNPEIVGALDLLKNGAPLTKQSPNPGKMYEVNLNADPAHFLDWDKPLAQMSPEVQQKLNSAWLAHTDAHAQQTGSRIYHAAADASGAPVTWNDRGMVYAADKMRDAGIPGIRYLDQGSRGAGQGSSNYVMFDDKMIDILRKYGIAGMIAPPIFAGAMSEQKQ